MDLKISSDKLFTSKHVIFAIILINLVLLLAILIFYFKPFSFRNAFKNAQPAFWPAYSIPNSPNNIELLANIRLHQLQNTQNKENIQLASSTLEIITGTIESDKQAENWTDRLASTILSTEDSLKTIIDVVDFSELLDESSSIWSLLPPSAVKFYNIHKNKISGDKIERLKISTNEKWLEDYYQLKSSNFNNLN